MEALAIIPARGGSKGIPRKNVAPLCGRPLVDWSIQAAAAATRVQRVVVSTDDAEIAAVARRSGAEVVWRPEQISGDLASSEDALLHTLKELRVQENYTPDLVAFLQCTSPLTTAADIDGTISALQDQDADTALAVTDFHYFLWETVGDDLVGVNHHKAKRLLRQQAQPQYLESGAVYVMRTPGFLEHRHRFFGKTVHYRLPRERCWEIDDPVDLKIAEMLLREQQRTDRYAALPNRLSAIVLDFDGVITDNRVLVFEDGQEAVLCNRSDGMGISRLKTLGLPILVLSSEKNPVVAARCRKLGIECIHGVDRKQQVLAEWLGRKRIAAEEVVFVGNDINDLECLRMVGCPVVVGDAHPAVTSAARIVLESNGGQAAVRELADFMELGIHAGQGICHAASA